MRLLEARTIKNSDDVIDLLKSGKLAGRLGGKKFIPSWCLTDEQSLKDLVDVTLDTIGDDPNIAGDEVIQFMIKACPEDSTKWANVLEQNPDTLIELANALKADWFKKSAEWQERLNELINQPFNTDKWHKLEKDIQDVFAKRAAKKGKKINNTDSLYEKLYDDGIWKVFKVKSFEGDVELASHIEPFESDGETYTKTRWCTAADQRYYKHYTEEGNSLYVIQQYSKKGVYKNAWQIAFWSKSRIEFMNKSDKPSFSTVEKMPREALETIVVDNEKSSLVDCTLAELFDITPKVTRIYSDPSLKREAMTQLLPKENGMTLTRRGGLVKFTNDDINNETFVVPESLTSLDSVESLRDCQFFKKVIIKSHIKTLTPDFTQAFTGAEEFVLPEGLLSIENGTFKYLDITKVNLPSTLREIGDGAFGSTNLQEIEIPEGITSIKPDTFCNCSNLERVSLPSTLKTIEPGAFENCVNLQQIDLPEGLEEIGRSAISNTAITELVVPSTIKKLGPRCFLGNGSLVSVDIKAENIEEIGNELFANCENLEQIRGIKKVASSKDAFLNTKISLEDINSFSTILTKDLFRNLEKPNLRLPSNFKKIGKIACSSSEILETFTSSENLIAINREAFERCSNLRVVDLSGSPNLVVIASYAFADCRNLEKVILPENLEEIQEGAFQNCKNLKEIVLPNKIRRISKECFAGCESLETVKLPKRLQVISTEAFRNCTSLQNIELPTTLSQLGQEAFARCESLTQIRIPRRVTSIPERAFIDSGLVSVEITDNVQEILGYAFCRCKNLIDIKVTNVENDEEFDQYEDISYAKTAFEDCPYQEVLEAAGVFKKRDYSSLLDD